MPREGDRGHETRAIAYDLHDQPIWSSRMSNRVKVTGSIFLFLVVAAGFPSETSAQPALDGWRWDVSGNVFAGLNEQVRKGDDLTDGESQNWLMGTGRRPLKTGEVSVHTMFSFEPFTLKDIGSAQVFQT